MKDQLGRSVWPDLTVKTNTSVGPRDPTPKTLATLQATQALLLEGLSWREIEERLGIPTTTMKTYRQLYITPEDREAVAAVRRAAVAEHRASVRRGMIGAIRDWTALHGAPPSVHDWDLGRFRQPDRQWPSAANVLRYFRTWNAAIHAAGLTPRAPGRRRREPDRTKPPKPCVICGKPSKPLRKGRCNACESYRRYHGHDRRELKP